MKIGIPRAMLYYEYGVLWKEFFNKLNIETLVSPESNKNILKNGADISIDENCLPCKLFFGHIKELLGKCDYIFVPRYEGFSKTNQVCFKFLAFYDLAVGIFKDVKFLTVNIGCCNEEKEFVKLGQSLGYEKRFAASAYEHAHNCYIENKKQKHNAFFENLYAAAPQADTKPKILIVGHNYLSYDSYLIKPVADFFKNGGSGGASGNNIELLFACDYHYDVTDKYYENISKDLYWYFNKALLSALVRAKSFIDGIIFISAFPCGPDALTNELAMRKIKDIPKLNIILDELSSDAGLVTRLECFTDIISKLQITNYK